MKLICKPLCKTFFSSNAHAYAEKKISSYKATPENKMAFMLYTTAAKVVDVAELALSACFTAVGLVTLIPGIFMVMFSTEDSIIETIGKGSLLLPILSILNGLQNVINILNVMPYVRIVRL